MSPRRSGHGRELLLMNRISHVVLSYKSDNAKEWTGNCLILSYSNIANSGSTLPQTVRSIRSTETVFCTLNV